MKKTIITLLILMLLITGGHFIYKDLTPVDAGNGDITVNAYNLTVTEENCTVTIKRGTETIIAGEDVLNEDDTIIITAIADDGYEMDTLLLNDVEIASGDSYVVTGNVTIVASAEEGDVIVTYNLTVNAENCTITIKCGTETIIAGEDVLNEDDTIIITAIADDGYEMDTLLLNDIEIASGDSHVVTGNVTIVATAVEELVNPEPYVVQNGLKLVYNVSGNNLKIGLAGYNGEFNTYGCEYDWDIYLNDEFYNNYSGVTAFNHCVTITVERGEHVVCLEDKTGNDYCARSVNFFGMFDTSLIEVYGYGNAYTGSSEMPNYCFSEMFVGCENLIIAPELPATTLSDNCYSRMFAGCKNLTIAPELLATTLTFSCYNSMFAGCENLTTAPELLATTLVDLCYYGMFAESGLTTAPELPATILANFCYCKIFKGCSSLTSVTCYYPFNLDSTFASNWLDNIPTTGTLKSPDAVITYCLPENWTAVAINESDPGDPEPYAVQNGLKLVYNLSNDDDSLNIGLAGLNGNVNTYGYAYDWDIYLDNKFYENISGITASNNIFTITDLEPGEYVVCLEDKTGNDYCARSVNFVNTDTDYKNFLIEVYGYGNAYNGSSAMPDYCYYTQFSFCENLTIAPELPKKELSNYCYSRMFQSCGLTVMPVKPTFWLLADYCCSYMFSGCKNLITIPSLTVGIAFIGCFEGMFYGCENLKTVSDFYIYTAIAEDCLKKMFCNCIALNEIWIWQEGGELFNLNDFVALDWLGGITCTGTVSSYNAIITYGLPENWTATKIPEVEG